VSVSQLLPERNSANQAFSKRLAMWYADCVTPIRIQSLFEPGVKMKPKSPAIFLALCITLALASLPGSTHAASREVIFLKNGSIIKGDIIEQVPQLSLKMRTNDGSVFVYKMEEVEKITKEDIPGAQAESGMFGGGVSAPEPARQSALSISPASGGFGIWTAIALPMGDYGKTSSKDDDIENLGFAEQGFAGGMQFYFPALIVPGLLWTTDIAFIMNDFDGKAFEGDRYSTFEAPTYRHVPVLTGGMFQLGIYQNVEIYAIGQLGVNFLLPSSAQYTYHDPAYPADDESIDYQFDGATSLAFAVGTGLRINRRFTLGFKFMNLGEPKIDVTVEKKGESTANTSFKKAMALGLIAIGAEF
jgi:hypothetical protein